MNIKNARRCCFTGHRPEKLNINETEVKKRLKEAILNSIKDGFIIFISGMSRGVDMWAAEIVLELRKEDKSIKLICISPYRGFEKFWNEDDKAKYNNIIKKADYVKFLCEKYSKMSFQMRNYFMVNHSARVIAAYNSEKGGTKNTINYALSKNLEVINVLENSVLLHQGDKYDK